MTLSRHIAGVFSANLTNLVLSLGNSIFLARILGVEGKGEFAVFSASFGFLALVLGLGLDVSLRYYVAQEQVDRQTLMTAILGYALACGLVVTGLAHVNHLVLDNEIFLPRGKQGWAFELVLGGMVAATVAQTNLSSVFTGMRRFTVVNRATVAFAALSLLLWGGLFWGESRGVFEIGSGGVFRFYLSLAGLHALVLALFAWSRLDLRPTLRLPSRALVARMVGYGFIGFLASSAQFLNYRLDYWLVQGLAGTTALGLYSLASGLAAMLWVLPRSVATVLMPAMAAADEGASTEHAAQVSRVVVSVLLAGGIPLALSSPLWIRLAYGPEFVAAWLPFTILLGGCVPFAVTVVLAGVFAAHDRMTVNLAASTLGLAVTVILDLLLIPPYGLVGAAAASATSYLTTTAYMLVRFRELTGMGILATVVPRPGDLHSLLERAP